MHFDFLEQKNRIFAFFFIKRKIQKNKQTPQKNRLFKENCFRKPHN